MRRESLSGARDDGDGRGVRRALPAERATQVPLLARGPAAGAANRCSCDSAPSPLTAKISAIARAVPARAAGPSTAVVAITRVSTPTQVS
ncbi:hypothetical protein GS496_19500 [Rhodococcus hoagii]|nr:hypothetical protein [Prescottella equi]